MDRDHGKENKGELFIRRVQQVLKFSEPGSADELAEKVEEMRDLMITLAKMLKHTIQKVHKLDAEKESLSFENQTMASLLKEMENNLHIAEINVGKYASQCEQYEKLKNQYEKMKKELNDKNKQNRTPIANSRSADSLKRKKTITNFKNCAKSCSGVSKDEIGFPVLDQNSTIYSKGNPKFDWNIHKLQSFILEKEQTWHQISGREREQRLKLSRLIKEMKILQNQLDWKSNQLAFKEAEVREKTKQLNEAGKKINELKKYLRKNKSHD